MVLALRRVGRPSLPACQGRRTLTPPLLSARAVARTYGRVVALAPASLEVGGGDALALIGPNGAGKSTLLSILAGALEPSSGSVETGPFDHREPRVGWVPQKPAHYQRLTPRENLELFARLEGLEQAGEVADRFIALLEVPDDGRLTEELSAGNQQRLNLAVALLGKPDVLLLDEPTASLDPARRTELAELLRNLVQQGRTLVIATHDDDFARGCATRILRVEEGRVAGA